MTSILTNAMSEPPGWGRTHPRVATVLMATDGTEQSDGALSVALQRAAEMGASVTMLAVASEKPILAPEASVPAWTEATAVRRTALRQMIESQLVRVTGHEGTHAVMLLDGAPSETIARVAVEQRVALIVVGLGRHDVADRLFSDETALKLARVSRVPVLAVPATARAIPRHAVVAVDFSDISKRAAQAAIEAVGDSGRVELVHVMPYLQEDPFTLEATAPYLRWTNEELANLMAQLVVPEGVTVSTAAIRGRPAQALLDYAQRAGADLISTGTHGRGFIARAMLGSVTSQLIRAATCCILTVPRDPLPALTAAQREELGLSGGTPRRAWNSMLADFTIRNSGRHTILEVEDLEIGAQVQAYNYPLVGTAYDISHGRVEIILGDRSASGRHLGRSIGDVIGLDILTDAHGKDIALRLEHGTSQTLLSFVS